MKLSNKSFILLSLTTATMLTGMVGCGSGGDSDEATNGVCTQAVKNKYDEATDISRHYKRFYPDYSDFQKESQRERAASHYQKHVDHYTQLKADADELYAMPNCSRYQYGYGPLHDQWLSQARTKSEENISKYTPSLKLAHALSKLYSTTGIAPEPNPVQINGVYQLIDESELANSGLRPTLLQVINAADIFIPEANAIVTSYPNSAAADRANLYIALFRVGGSFAKVAVDLGQVTWNSSFREFYDLYISGNIGRPAGGGGGYGGGGGGGGGNPPPPPPGPQDKAIAKQALCSYLKKHYPNISVNSTDEEIKKVCKVHLLKRHPDKMSAADKADPVKWKEANESFNTFQTLRRGYFDL